MTNNPDPRSSRAPEQDIKDLLARLYREIGISAVAAALEVTSWKSDSKTDAADRTADAPAPQSGKGLAA